VRGTSPSVGIAVSIFAERSCRAGEIAISECPARVVMYKSGSMEGLCVKVKVKVKGKVVPVLN
jgi:hypothetical protein